MQGARTSTALPAEASSAGAARRLVRDQLQRAGARDEAFADAVVLVTSELVTNAVRHATGEALRLLLEVGPASASVGVQDGSPTHPTLVEPYEGGGRGMVVVATVAGRWHVEDLPRGKVVWAHLRAGGGAAAPLDPPDPDGTATPRG